MLCYARQLSKWTKQQLYPSPAYVSGSAVWHKNMSNRIEITLEFINPGSSLITILVLVLRKWSNKTINERRKHGVPIGPWHNRSFTLVVPFSELPDDTNWQELSAQLGQKGDGIKLEVDVRYLTGPSGQSTQTGSFCFRLWGVLPAADGSLIDIEQISC